MEDKGQEEDEEEEKVERGRGRRRQKESETECEIARAKEVVVKNYRREEMKRMEMSIERKCERYVKKIEVEDIDEGEKGEYE